MGITQKLKMYLPFDTVIPLMRIYWKKPKILIQKNIRTLTFTTVLFTISQVWKESKWM